MCSGSGEDTGLYEGGSWLAPSYKEWCILVHDNLIPSLCLPCAAFLSLPFVSRACLQLRCHRWVEDVQRALGEEVSLPVLSTLASNNRKIKNWLSQIQDEDGLGLLPKLKLVHVWFACPVNGKKSEFTLNSLGKTHWQLWLCVWSFKVLWQCVGVLHCLLAFISVLYCCGWSQVLICPDPMWTEGLWSYLVCETQSHGWGSSVSLPSWTMIPVVRASEMKCQLHQFQRQRIRS